jgi:cytolysin-activating lysine-acyltransferase
LAKPSEEKPLKKTAAANKTANGAKATASAGAPLNAATQKQASANPAQTAKMSAIRQTLQLRMGQIVLAAARLPRYRDLPLKTLMATFLEALQRDKVAFAEKDGELVGMALWASVSDSVSTKIAKQIEDKIFPLELAASDWNSGENIWLLDVIVPGRKAGTAVFLNFAQLIGEKSFRLHPVVAQSVEADLVQKINAMLAGSSQGGNAKPVKAPKKEKLQ